ncbi:Putative uncharacterized protein [Moritella viscosa]|uniref:Uncharacterized protein n=1 Tax=Moritella viscosa TaxID=80854 RepID=A0ABY1HJA3_9GAMM|nr:Putative uncharacterized protein [Moritella viscosa]SGZ07735.1 Putative uncharacterized protein [Moritella viscosa]SHO27100.1 Putative uncharacterized protein [Moritella viscosa]
MAFYAVAKLVIINANGKINQLFAFLLFAQGSLFDVEDLQHTDSSKRTI